MRPAPFRPAKGQIFVCVNHRTPGDALGGGCGARGDRVFVALRQEAGRRSLGAAVWLTRTHCLGLCPKIGAAVAVSPPGTLWTEVVEGDAAALLAPFCAKMTP